MLISALGRDQEGTDLRNLSTAFILSREASRPAALFLISVRRSGSETAETGPALRKPSVFRRSSAE